MIGLPQGLAKPVLVSCADGVGTKLLVAIAMERHNTVGIDLVAMNVNDLICTGASPLFLLDYVACGQLNPGVVESIVSGIVEGCTQSGCALLGGETAELPGMYAKGHYDLAAFAVGTVDRDARLGPHNVRVGDVILALPSSGLHSNGYSLARKALLDPDYAGLALDAKLPGTQVVVGEALLEPTRIYVRAMAAALAVGAGAVRSAAHITGGGLIENPPRALPGELAMELDLSVLTRPAVFEALEAAGVPNEEMLRTFNGGIGMLLVVNPERSLEVSAALEAAGEQPVAVGHVLMGQTGAPAVRFSTP